MEYSNFKSGFPSGTNIRMLLQDCNCDSALFNNTDIVTKLIQKCLLKSGLTYLNSTHHNFDEGGYTLAIILSESHVVIHTWSEHNRMVLVELSICDFTRNNNDNAHKLAQSLSGLFCSQKSLVEVTGMIPRIAKPLATGHGFYVDMNELIITRESAWQKISVTNTEAFGTALILDDVFQTTEKDHAFYHEPLVHVPMILHEKPEQVLICGGGDGGAAYEVLKHPSVKHCDIVEIDKQVIEISSKHLYEINQNSLVDDRVHIHIEDASNFLQSCKQIYDVIIIDATNPVEDEDSMYSKDFYKLVISKLSDNGTIGLHAGLPYTQPEETQKHIKNINSAFQYANPYLAFVPSFGTVSCFYLCSSNISIHIEKDEICKRIQTRGLTNLQLFSTDMIKAWFTIPPNLSKFV